MLGRTDHLHIGASARNRLGRCASDPLYRFAEGKLLTCRRLQLLLHGRNAVNARHRARHYLSRNASGLEIAQLHPEQSGDHRQAVVHAVSDLLGQTLGNLPARALGCQCLLSRTHLLRHVRG